MEDEGRLAGGRGDVVWNAAPRSGGSHGPGLVHWLSKWRVGEAHLAHLGRHYVGVAPGFRVDDHPPDSQTALVLGRWLLLAVGFLAFLVVVV